MRTLARTAEADDAVVRDAHRPSSSNENAAAVSPAADFTAALCPELPAALDALDTLDGRDPIALKTALAAVADATTDHPQLRAFARLACIQRLEQAIGARRATAAANLVFAEPDPTGTPVTTAPVAGTAISYEADVPADEAVDLAVLLDDLHSFVAERVHLSADAATAIALWVVHTYAADCVRQTPYLIINSPVKRCGKSTLLDVLTLLVYRAQPAANATPAALFRLIAQFRPTLLLDEAERWLGGKHANPDLIAIVNAGNRAGTPALRTIGDDHEPAAFQVYGPKAIAGIGDLPDTVVDRGIVIAMRRKPIGIKVHRITRADDAIARRLRERIVRWVCDHRNELTDVDLDTVVLPDQLNDRARNAWEPLAAIAGLAGSEWLEAVQVAATRLSAGRDEDGIGVQLLNDLRRVFAKTGKIKILSQTMCLGLADLDEDGPWARWHRHMRDADERRIQPTDLAKLLSPFDVRPRQIKIGSQGGKGYRLADLADAIERYVGEPSAEAPQDDDEPE